MNLHKLQDGAGTGRTWFAEMWRSKCCSGLFKHRILSPKHPYVLELAQFSAFLSGRHDTSSYWCKTDSSRGLNPSSHKRGESRASGWGSSRLERAYYQLHSTSPFHWARNHTLPPCWWVWLFQERMYPREEWEFFTPTTFCAPRERCVTGTS